MSELIKDLDSLSKRVSVDNDNYLLKVIKLKAKHCLVRKMIDSIYCFV